MRFVAIDVETASPDRSSICQIGVAVFDHGKLGGVLTKLVNPEVAFSPMNIRIHGINGDTVRDQPLWPVVARALTPILSDTIVVSHGDFDAQAIAQACARYGIPAPTCRWLNNMSVVRRAWPDRFGSSGYGLENVATFLGINYRSHDAGEDARAAGEVFCRAIKHTGLPLERWFRRIEGPIVKKSARKNAIAREGADSGPLVGQVLAFTGSLSLQRQQAAALAAQAGCAVGSGVTSKTTLLVVGDQDISMLGGKEKSSKHIKAEQMIENGYPLRIISESEFMAMCQPM